MELRKAKGAYTDQQEIVDGILAIWKADYGKSGLDTLPKAHSPRNAAIVKGDVGTGKTPTAVVLLKELYGWLESIPDSIASLPTMVVCPKNTIFQWTHEIETWWREGIVITLTGNREDMQTWFSVWDVAHPKVVVCNYDKLTDYAEELRERGPYLCVVLDEVHSIAYADTQRNQAADSLVSYYRVGLSGTVVRRNADSLHGILNWANPGQYKNRLVAATAPFPVKGCKWQGTGWYKWHKKGSCAARHQPDSHCPLFIPDPSDKSKGFCAWTAKELQGKPERKHFYHLYSPEWKGYEEFKERYCSLECKKCGAKKVGYEWVGGGYYTNRNGEKVTCNHRYASVGASANEKELNYRLYEDTHLMWKMEAKNIPGFPEVFPKKIECILTSAQAELYKQAEFGLIRYLEESGEWGEKAVNNVLAQLSMLISVATLPPAVVQAKLQGNHSYPWMRGIPIPQDMNGGKQDWVEELLGGDGYFQRGDKVVLFSQFTWATNDYFRRVSEVLEEQGLYAIHIHGGSKTVEDDMAKFNSDEDCAVCVSSPAGATGVNLHKGLINLDGSHKDGNMWLVHSDCSWTPLEMTQRMGRVVRHGGKNAVAFFTVAVLPDGRPTIDSRMLARVMSRASASDLITGSNLSDLFDFGSKDDVMQLLGRGKRDLIFGSTH